MIKTYKTKKERQICDILETNGIYGNNSCHIYVRHEFFIDRIGEIIPILYEDSSVDTLTSCLGHLMNNPNIIIHEIEKQTQIVINFNEF